MATLRENFRLTSPAFRPCLRSKGCFYGVRGGEKGENLGFSTIFSTTVENFGGRPYGRRREGNVAQAPGIDTPHFPPVISRFLRPLSTAYKGPAHEAYISAEPPATEEDPWLPHPDGHQERAARAQAPSRERAQAADRLHALAHSACRRTASARRNGCGGKRTFSRSSTTVVASARDISPCCWPPRPAPLSGSASLRHGSWATPSIETVLND